MHDYWICCDRTLGVDVHNYPERALFSMSKAKRLGTVYRAWDRSVNNRYKVADGTTPIGKLPFIYRSQVAETLKELGLGGIAHAHKAPEEISLAALEECLNGFI